MANCVLLATAFSKYFIEAGQLEIATPALRRLSAGPAWASLSGSAGSALGHISCQSKRAGSTARLVLPVFAPIVMVVMWDERHKFLNARPQSMYGAAMVECMQVNYARMFIWHKDQKAVPPCLLQLLSEYAGLNNVLLRCTFLASHQPCLCGMDKVKFMVRLFTSRSRKHAR